jgi:hypothetical protein
MLARLYEISRLKGSHLQNFNDRVRYQARLNPLPPPPLPAQQPPLPAQQPPLPAQQPDSPQPYGCNNNEGYISMEDIDDTSSYMKVYTGWDSILTVNDSHPICVKSGVYRDFLTNHDGIDFMGFYTINPTSVLQILDRVEAPNAWNMFTLMPHPTEEVFSFIEIIPRGYTQVNMGPYDLVHISYPYDLVRIYYTRPGEPDISCQVKRNDIVQAVYRSMDLSNPTSILDMHVDIPSTDVMFDNGNSIYTIRLQVNMFDVSRWDAVEGFLNYVQYISSPSTRRIDGGEYISNVP